MKWLTQYLQRRSANAFHKKLLSLVYNGSSYYFAEEVKQMADEKADLTKADITLILMSTISTMLENRDYYYQSSVDSHYNHLTPAGKAAILAVVEMLAPKLVNVNAKEFDDKVKQHVWDTLKK